MGNTNYVVAFELSSSKISGAVGIETHEGIMILATASTPVDGFISKGVVRNVDKTSESINSIINTLETNLHNSGRENVSIKKAYISIAGLTVHTINSRVTKGFDNYTKITAAITDELENENDIIFNIPKGYKRIGVVTQEYRTDGKVENNPIGAHAMQLECNYLNIVIKEQFFKQLNECFNNAKLEIADSFVAARMDAEIMLTKDACRNGCALVNIGAETTTISIYNNNFLRNLAVLPLGSDNITMDICAEQVSYDEAEEMKITRGYMSPNNETEPVNTETLNNIINARMYEILQNVKYQIEESNDPVDSIVFTGGGSRLKNFKLLIDEYLPNFRTEIKDTPTFTLLSAPGVNTTDVFSTALYGLLTRGKENCCEIPEPKNNNGSLFGEEDFRPVQPQDDAAAREEERRRAEDEESAKREKEAEEKRRKKEAEKEKEEEKEIEQPVAKKKKEKKNWGIGRMFNEWFNSATHGDEEDDDEEESNEEQNEENDEKKNKKENNK